MLTHPHGRRGLTPYLVVRGAARAIDFYKHAFGAREVMRVPSPDGKSIMHAEIRIGDSAVMLTDERVASGTKSPLSVGGTASSVYVLVEDADEQFYRAIAAGATRKVGLCDAFWGHRWGVLTDPFGHDWQIGSPHEKLSVEQIAQRAKQQPLPMER